MIKIKRIYDAPKEDDGYRILVDRAWPPGFSKSSANMNVWLKEVGPTNVLKKWFNHDPAKWEEFKKRYFEELKDNDKDKLVNTIIDKSKEGNVTLLYGSVDVRYNGAIALQEYIESIQKKSEEPKNDKIEKIKDVAEDETEEGEDDSVI